jgi:hypothetical protein
MTIEWRLMDQREGARTVYHVFEDVGLGRWDQLCGDTHAAEVVQMPLTSPVASDWCCVACLRRLLHGLHNGRGR